MSSLTFNIGVIVGVVAVGWMLDIAWYWQIAAIVVIWLIRRIARAATGRGDFFDFDGFGDGGGDGGGGD